MQLQAGYLTTLSVLRLYNAGCRMITECGAVSGMRIGRGNQSTQGKPAQVPPCPPEIPHDLTRDQTQAAMVGSQQNVGKTKEISLSL
jgi:hypothetical protein